MIRILIAEGSATVRRTLRDIFGAGSEAAVVGEAADGPSAIAMTSRLRPDVIVMDVDIPDMGGFNATKQIMTETPTPIVILSAEHSESQAEVSMQALRAGALTVLARPTDPAGAGDGEARRRFVGTVVAMSQVKLVRHWPARASNVRQRSPAEVASAARAKIVAIAASTGGPTAIQSVLSQLPPEFPAPILVVQHIASGFVGGFVNWLNTACSLRVKVAEHAEPLAPRTVFVAPDEHHLGVGPGGSIQLSAAPPIGGFRPSATFLFESVANVMGQGVLAIVLTGMGRDGIEGLQPVRTRGGRVLAQDEATSVVFGMPQAAIATGCVDTVLPLSAIAPRILDLIQR
jgi:two-component system chemotaxis response regulator CheB